MSCFSGHQEKPPPVEVGWFELLGRGRGQLDVIYLYIVVVREQAMGTRLKTEDSRSFLVDGQPFGKGIVYAYYLGIRYLLME